MHIHLDDLIACGGNGRVYRAHTTSDEKPRTFAVKKLHTNKQIQRPMLRHEACAMIQLRGHPSIPEVYALGRSQYAEYLALELLGPDIYIGTLDSPSGLTMRNLVALACQMIDALQHVHSHGIVHCDVKPGNFLFDLNLTGRIKLIDFGMAKLYRDAETLEHRPQGRIPYFVGTKMYASLNAHYHLVPSRRDDFESLALTFLTLLCGRLPWQNLHGAAILPEKAKWSGGAIAVGHPPVFGALLDDARTFDYDAEPHYAAWKQRLRGLVPGLADSPLYDPSDRGWSVGVAHWQHELPAVPISTPPQSVHEVLPDSDDDWVPTSDWPEPMNVPLEDLLGDERETVERIMEKIDEVPTMDEIWTNPNFCGPEYMVGY